MGPELKLGLNSRPSHEIAERRDSGYIRGIRGSVSSFRASPRKRDPAWRSLLRGRGVSLKGECVLRLPRFRRDFMRSRPGGLPAKSFYGKRGTTREVAHWCWRNELYDPLSSFVPELEPRRRRGFSFGSGPSPAQAAACSVSAPPPSAAGYRGRWRLVALGSPEIKTCGRDRGRAKFPFCSLPSSSRCAGGPFDRASRDAPAPRRPRSACHFPELDG